jgi:hypothetical protein
VALDLERLERQLEAFLRHRRIRDWRVASAEWSTLDLEHLHEDFPDLNSYELWNDVQDTAVENPARKRAVMALLAAAHIESRTVGQLDGISDNVINTTTIYDDQTVAWRGLRRRWTVEKGVGERHKLEELWREELRRTFNDDLEQLQEKLIANAQPLDCPDWLNFWADLKRVDVPGTQAIADEVLKGSEDYYGATLRAYLGQLELPIDDVWQSDMDYALRASKLDVNFPSKQLMPTMVRTFRELGIDIESHTAIKLDLADRVGKTSGPSVFATEVPGDAQLLLRRTGGFRDYQALLYGLGMAESVVQVDPSFPFAERYLGDEVPSRGYGLLLSGLTLEPSWLRERLEFDDHYDYRIIATIGRLHEVRRAAAMVGYETQLWRDTAASGGLAEDYAERLSVALRMHVFPESYLTPLMGAPWNMFDASVDLLAHVFAAQLRQFLRKEFDEDWFKSPRAGRFLTQELWRPGRRYSAVELLGHMGFDGFQPSVLLNDMSEVLKGV